VGLVVEAVVLVEAAELAGVLGEVEVAVDVVTAEVVGCVVEEVQLHKVKAAISTTNIETIISFTLLS
jgi:hypothetical protein